MSTANSKKLSKEVLMGIKTCADRIKNDIDTTLDTKLRSSKFDAPAMRAAFLKGKILRSYTILKCAFLHQPPSNLVRTSTGEMLSAVDENGVSIPVDPLQFEVDDMEIIPAIIHCVTTRLQPIVNIKLSFYEDEEKKTLWNPNVADIRISFDPMGGAWSLLGRDILETKTRNAKHEATMNLGWFDVATTLHEFCHSLGMVHEHQNPNGKAINWNVDAVHQWAEESQGWDSATTDTNIIKKYSKDQINGSEYDPLSIMLYFFPGTPLVNDDKGNCCGSGTQQNFQFSPFDVLFLNKIYPLKNQNLTPEQFTVKFCNDNFNQKVDIEILKKQVKLNDERESKVKKEGGDEENYYDKETTEDVKDEESVEKFHALQPMHQSCGCNSNYSDDLDDDVSNDYIKSKNNCGKSKNNYSYYLFVILLIISIVLLGYLLFYNCSDDGENNEPSAPELPMLSKQT